MVDKSLVIYLPSCPLYVLITIQLDHIHPIFIMTKLDDVVNSIAAGLYPLNKK
jgi:hypothetical protein